MKTVFVDKETGDTWTEDLARPPEPGEIVGSTIPGKDRPYQVIDAQVGQGDVDIQVTVSEFKPLPRIG